MTDSGGLRTAAVIFGSRRVRMSAVVVAATVIGVGVSVVSTSWLALALILGAVAAFGGLAASGLLGRPHPAIGLSVLVLSVPLRSSIDVEVSGISIGLTEIVLPFSLAWLVAFRRPGPFVLPGPALLMVVFVGLAVSTVNWAAETPPAFKEFAKWIEALVALLAAFDLARNRRDLRLVFVAGGAALGAEATIGLAQSALGVGPDSFLVRTLIRAYGTFEQPNPFAGYLGLHLPFALAFAFRVRGPWRWIGALLWIVGGAAVVLSLSRGAWLGFAVGTAIVVWYSVLRGRLGFGFWAPLAAVAVLVLAVGHFSFRLDDRIPERARLVGEGLTPPAALMEDVTPGSYAVVQRLAFWTAAGRMFAANPIGGVGLGNYESRYADFNVGAWPDSLGHAHNFYLNLAAETGLVGLVPFFALAVVLLRRSWRAACRIGPSQVAAIGAFASLGAFSAHNLVDSIFVGGMGVIAGAAAGIALAADGEPGKEGPSGNRRI